MNESKQLRKELEDCYDEVMTTYQARAKYKFLGFSLGFAAV